MKITKDKNHSLPASKTITEIMVIDVTLTKHRQHKHERKLTDSSFQYKSKMFENILQVKDSASLTKRGGVWPDESQMSKVQQSCCVLCHEIRWTHRLSQAHKNQRSELEERIFKITHPTLAVFGLCPRLPFTLILVLKAFNALKQKLGK